MLAARVGCSPATIRKLEAEERRPSRDVALALASALGVPEAERRAFVRFARGGWADRPPEAAPVPDLERPWAGSAGAAAAPNAAGKQRVRTPARPASQPEAAGAPPAAVARETELSRLAGALEDALAGRGGVAFVAGEAGQGKTTLLRSFAERAMEAHAELLVATGICNAYTGSGDPFLPFREVLQQLTGEVPAGPALELFDAARARRLQRFAPRAVRVVVERGPQLVGTLLPVEPFRERAGRAGAAVPEERPRDRAAQATPFGERFGAPAHAALTAATARVLTAVADERPLLLLLDDLQWLDRSSAELLLHLGRVAASRRVLVLGAYRPADVAAEQEGRSHVMRGVVHEVERVYGDAVLDLDRADGRAFLEVWLDSQPNRLGGAFREALWRQTGGQPLFTIELVRSMVERGDLVRDRDGRWTEAPGLRWDALPRRVAGALAARVGRLEPLAMRILRVASVEGELFSAEAVARVVGRDAPEVAGVLGRELDRRHRLVAGVDVKRVANGLLARYRFRHNLIQRFVYEGIDEAERSYLHVAVAEALESLSGDAADPVALAYHYARAHMPDRAAVHHRRAGDRARKAGALDQAIEHYREALASWSRADVTGRASLLRDLGECQWIRGARQDARRSLSEALAGFRAAGDAQGAGAVQLTIARTHYEDGDWNRSLETSLEALALLEEGPETAELAWAQSSLSVLHMTASRKDEGLTWARRALATAERVGAEHVRPQALTNVASCLCSLGPDHAEEGLSLFVESYRLAERLGLAYEAGRATYNRGDALRELGRFDEAEAVWEEFLEYSGNHQVALGLDLGRYQLWRLRWRQGRWAACFAERPELLGPVGVEGGRESPVHALAVLLASADLDVGAVPRASAMLARHEAVLRRLAEPQYRCPYLRDRLRVAAASGRAEEADAVALEIAETLRGRRYDDSVLPPALTALAWIAERGPENLREAGRACLEGLEEAAARCRTPETRAAAAEARGTLAAAGGDPEAAAHLLDAAAHWQACGFPLDEARTRAAAARALTRSGRDAGASSERDRAGTVLSGLASQLPSDELRRSFGRVQRDLLSSFGTPPG